MSEIVKFISDMIEQRLTNLHTCMLGRIERFDHQNMTANVQPLAKRKFVGKEPQAMPLLINVPVSFLKAGAFFIRPPYKKGDLVLVVFTEQSLDGVSSCRHSLDDGVVVGGISTAPLPDEHGGDFVIAKDDFKVKIIIDMDDNISLETETGDLNFTTKNGDINIGSINGDVNIRGKSRSESW